MIKTHPWMWIVSGWRRNAQTLLRITWINDMGISEGSNLSKCQKKIWSISLHFALTTLRNLCQPPTSHAILIIFRYIARSQKERERAHDQLTKVNQLSFNNTNPRIIWVLLPDIIFRMYSNVVYRKLSLVSEWLHIVNDAPIMRASCPPPFCMTCWHATALCRVGEWTSSSLPDGSQKGHVKYYTCSHRVHPCVF